MFVSKLSKWEWFKIYLVFHYRYSLKSSIKRRKKLFFYSLTVYIICWLLLNNHKIVLSLILFLAVMTIMPMIILTLTYSPKCSILFLSKPSSKGQEKISKRYPSVSYDFNVLLDQRFQILIENHQYFLLYPYVEKKKKFRLFVIKKKENQKQLTKSGASISQLIRPLCDEYKKL